MLNLGPTSPLRRAIYAWAKKELEMEFVWEDQDEHRLNKPYGTLKISPGFKRLGGTDNIRRNADGTFTIAGGREFTVSLNCYGDNALGRASFVHSSIEKLSVTDTFSLAGLVCVSASQPIDLSRVVNNNFEARCQIDVRFRVSQEVLDIREYFEIVDEITGEIIS